MEEKKEFSYETREEYEKAIERSISNWKRATNRWDQMLHDVVTEALVDEYVRFCTPRKDG